MSWALAAGAGGGGMTPCEGSSSIGMAATSPGRAITLTPRLLTAVCMARRSTCGIWEGEETSSLQWLHSLNS